MTPPKLIVIHCGSSDEYGDLANSFALLTREQLEDAHATIELYRSQIAKGNILAIRQSHIAVGDYPHALAVCDRDFEDCFSETQSPQQLNNFPEIKLSGIKDEVGYPIFFAFEDISENEDYVDKTESPSIFWAEQIIYRNKERGKEDTFSLYWRCEIKHCNTIVTTQTIESTTLEEILDAWDQLEKESDIETEKILKNNDDDIKMGG